MNVITATPAAPTITRGQIVFVCHPFKTKNTMNPINVATHAPRESVARMPARITRER
jgi:hypothetical protein